MTDIKSIFYWSHVSPNFEMKEIPVSPSLSKLSYIEQHTFEMLLERLTECPKAFSF